MGNELDTTRKRLKWYQKVGYSVGDMGENFCWTFVSSFVLLYFTNVLGLKPGIVGLLMMLSKFLDGVSDFFMGQVIDHTKSRMGKARFWLFASSFPLAISLVLLFNVPAGFSDMEKYIYIFILYSLMGAVFYTMSNIAYTSLSALITKNSEERVQIQSIRFVFAALAIFGLSAMTSALVEVFGGGQQGWRMVSILYAAICLACVMITVLSVREIPKEEMEDVNVKAAEEKESFWQTIITLLKNKYFDLLLGCGLVTAACSGVATGILVYYTTYCLNNASLMGILSMASMVPAILVLPFVPKLCAKFSVQKASFFGYVVVVFGSIICYIGGFLSGVPVIIFGLFIRALGLGPYTAGSNVLVAEADEYSYLKYGKRVTATIFSCVSIGGKVGAGIGTAVCGFLLEFAKYDSTLETQSSFTQNVIFHTYFGSLLVAGIATLLIIHKIDVEKENARLRQELENNKN